MKQIQNKANSDEYTPSQKLRTFTEALLNPNVSGNKSMAERVTGIRRDLFLWNLKNKPEFRKWFNDQCDIMLLSFQARVDSKLLHAINTLDVQAMKTYYERIGRLKEKNEQSLNVNITPNREFKISSIIDHGSNGNAETKSDDLQLIKNREQL